MGKKNKVARNQSPGVQKAKNVGKQTPTPKSQPKKKLEVNDFSSDDSGSSVDEYEALLTGPKVLTNKNKKTNEKIPDLVPIKENGSKGPKPNVKAKNAAGTGTPGKPMTQDKTPGKQGAENKTPGKQGPEKKTPGKQEHQNKTPGKSPGNQTQTPGKKQDGKKTPETKAVNSAQKKPVPGVQTPSVGDQKQKKRAREEMEDSSEDEDVQRLENKIAKTSSTPEKIATKKTLSPAKSSPVKATSGKVQSPEKPASGKKEAVEVKSETKAKTPAVAQGKKRARDEDDDDDAEESFVPAKKELNVNQTKKLKGAAAGAKKDTTSNLQDDLAKDQQFRAQADKCQLFIKNFSSDITEKEILALSPDIKDVQLRKIFSKKLYNRSFAYLMFKDEKTADANFKLLSGRKLGSDKIVVDFVGVKSQNQKHDVQLKEEDLDFTRLYVRGFNKMTESELKALFPTAESVSIPLKKKDNQAVGYAFVVYKTEEACRAAHNQMQGKVIDGQMLFVYFAKKSSKPRTEVPALLQSAKPKTTTASEVLKLAKPGDGKTTKVSTKDDDEIKKKKTKKHDEEDDDEENNDDDSDGDLEDDEDDDDDSDEDDSDDEDDDDDDDEEEDESDDSDEGSIGSIDDDDDDDE